MELDLWPRQHDLPPRWDGLPVEWGSWSDTADIIICPPPPRRPKCVRCGSHQDPHMNLGRVWTEPGMVRAIRRAQLSNGRHLVAHLAAFRCPDCEHDHVIDLVNDQAWDLDTTDYTDDGSYDVAAGRG
ncbi:hypothetical protein ACNUDN_29000 [Mycobacterium sp. smrl_JER01]|uniref:Uncharacterized protein n=2 Tax=Mycobacteriaceae TaxID=1762 RepID=A4TG28_MYCGI|nr:hypothetical protein MSZK_28170 [Mycobacterium sp. shizuoka-1]